MFISYLPSASLNYSNNNFLADVLYLIKVEGFGDCYHDGDCEHFRAKYHCIPFCNEGLMCDCGQQIKDENLGITNKDDNLDYPPFSFPN